MSIANLNYDEFSRMFRDYGDVYDFPPPPLTGSANDYVGWAAYPAFITMLYGPDTLTFWRHHNVLVPLDLVTPALTHFNYLPVIKVTKNSRVGGDRTYCHYFGMAPGTETGDFAKLIYSPDVTGDEFFVGSLPNYHIHYWSVEDHGWRDPDGEWFVDDFNEGWVPQHIYDSRMDMYYHSWGWGDGYDDPDYELPVDDGYGHIAYSAGTG